MTLQRQTAGAIVCLLCFQQNLISTAREVCFNCCTKCSILSKTHSSGGDWERLIMFIPPYPTPTHQDTAVATFYQQQLLASLTCTAAYTCSCWPSLGKQMAWIFQPKHLIISTQTMTCVQQQKTKQNLKSDRCIHGCKMCPVCIQVFKCMEARFKITLSSHQRN